MLSRTLVQLTRAHRGTVAVARIDGVCCKPGCVPTGAVRRGVAEALNVGDACGDRDRVAVDEACPDALGSRICVPTATLFASIPGFAARIAASVVLLSTAICDSVSPGTMVCTFGRAVALGSARLVGNGVNRVCVVRGGIVGLGLPSPPPQAAVIRKATANIETVLRIEPSSSDRRSGGSSHGASVT
jgi:hypothetical protein